MGGIMNGHLFMITGKSGSGKTTLWRKLWASEMENVAGYITVPYERDGVFHGYEMEDLVSKERRMISRRVGDKFVGVEDTFCGFGVQLLEEAVASDKEILILDELGRFEQHCEPFIEAVWTVINSSKTVCLVLKKESIPFLEEIKEKTGGILIDLDETGREKGEEMLKAAVLQSALSFHVQTRLFLKEKSFGPGPMRLLQDIRKSGSLSYASKQMGMSYSKAWTILKKIETEWGICLLKKQAGGNHGGSTQLTPEGEELLRRYETFSREVEEAAEKSFKKHFDRPIFL